MLLGAFAIIALLWPFIGIYGAFAYAVSQRKIWIRIALGTRHLPPHGVWHRRTPGRDERQAAELRRRAARGQPRAERSESGQVIPAVLPLDQIVG